ncbi:PEST proteolytic signal-containing nuclear protein isoform X2 [Dromiciops gliroides]|uniref:PEST proteolytic signal-containing nuclear protein isoform X2 n=1 Tax=Dromiciops gliroides TaxID=33562 RepID=UPI001CC5BA7B|nr:PEST proteolytic signal-containing nuclear protein isoform X2 [Dromiciops gliroides]
MPAQFLPSFRGVRGDGVTLKLPAGRGLSRFPPPGDHSRPPFGSLYGGRGGAVVVTSLARWRGRKPRGKWRTGKRERRSRRSRSEQEAPEKPKETVPTLAPKTLSVAAVFNEDDDSEPEEMPPEAKMRMKNIGRDTPTSAGPNSFNKGKHGFSDNQKLWERNIKSHLGNVHDQDDD